MEDDGEWHRAMEEAADSERGYGHQLRRLLVWILVQEDPNDPLKLFETFEERLSEDLLYRFKEAHNLLDQELTEDQLDAVRNLLWKI